MTEYTVCQCEEIEDGKCYVCVGNSPISALGLLDKDVAKAKAAEMNDLQKRLHSRFIKKLEPDQKATFKTPMPSGQYVGSIQFPLEPSDGFENCFVQCSGRAEYTLHLFSAPEDYNGGSIKVQYQNGKAIITPQRPNQIGGRGG